MSEQLLDCYDILQVQPNASPEQIRTGYRQQLNENHPDKLKGLRERYKDDDDPLLQQVLEKLEREAKQKTQQIVEAYRILSNLAEKARYDAQRLAQKSRRARPAATNDVHSDPSGAAANGTRTRPYAGSSTGEE